jgi:hypothetical protein
MPGQGEEGAMWKGTLIALALAILCGIPRQADARPKFIGNCLSDNGVKKLFQTYADVEQVGPWNSGEISARSREVFNPDIGIKGTTQTVIDLTKGRIDLSALPPGKTVVATLCGSLGEQGEKNAVAEDAAEKKMYPNGKPGHWCGYGGPRKGVCNPTSWFQGYRPSRHSIVFVNAGEAPQSGYVWAYVRPSDKSD